MHLVTFVEVPAVCHRFYGKIFWPPSLLYYFIRLLMGF